MVNNKEDYWAYLKTDAWKEKKTEIIEQKGLRCENCGREFPRWKLELHHRHYNMEFGTETKEDLILLCEECHESMHEQLPEKGITYKHDKTRCPECNQKMLKGGEIFKCFKCGISVEFSK